MILSSPEVVEIPPPSPGVVEVSPPPPRGRGPKKNKGTSIHPGSKYTCVMEVKIVCDWKCAKKNFF